MVAALVELVRATLQDYGWARPTWTTELLALTLSEVTHTQVRMMIANFRFPISGLNRQSAIANRQSASFDSESWRAI